MPVINVYEPALCCSTGVCGPGLDEAVVTFTADVDHLKSLGADISRHNLASDPAAFAGNEACAPSWRWPDRGAAADQDGSPSPPLPARSCSVTRAWPAARPGRRDL